jgi:sRNA-binding protein
MSLASKFDQLAFGIAASKSSYTKFSGGVKVEAGRCRVSLSMASKQIAELRKMILEESKAAKPAKADKAAKPDKAHPEPTTDKAQPEPTTEEELPSPLELKREKTNAVAVAAVAETKKVTRTRVPAGGKK